MPRRIILVLLVSTLIFLASSCAFHSRALSISFWTSSFSIRGRSTISFDIPTIPRSERTVDSAASLSHCQFASPSRVTQPFSTDLSVCVKSLKERDEDERAWACLIGITPCEGEEGSPD